MPVLEGTGAKPWRNLNSFFDRILQTILNIDLSRSVAGIFVVCWRKLRRTHKQRTSNADDQRVFRYRDSDVLTRTRPPHFHVLYGEHEAVINIRTLEVIAGKLPRRALALTIEWAAEHRSQLIEDWDLCQARQQPKKIPPLE